MRCIILFINIRIRPIWATMENYGPVAKDFSRRAETTRRSGPGRRRGRIAFYFRTEIAVFIEYSLSTHLLDSDLNAAAGRRVSFKVGSIQLGTENMICKAIAILVKYSEWWPLRHISHIWGIVVMMFCVTVWRWKWKWKLFMMIDSYRLILITSIFKSSIDRHISSKPKDLLSSEHCRVE